MNLNKVMLVGWLTRDPELHQFENGGKVANIGFVVHNRKRNAAGDWEDTPVWLQLKAFNRDHGRQLADFAAKLQKGKMMFVEGHLGLEEWTGKEDGKKHTKTVVYVDEMQFVGSRPADGGENGRRGALSTGRNSDSEAASAEPAVTEAPELAAVGTGGAGGDGGPIFGARQAEAGKAPRRLLGRPKRG